VSQVAVARVQELMLHLTGQPLFDFEVGQQPDRMRPAVIQRGCSTDRSLPLSIARAILPPIVVARTWLCHELHDMHRLSTQGRATQD
jgi:hypothetical protein